MGSSTDGVEDLGFRQLVRSLPPAYQWFTVARLLFHGVFFIPYVVLYGQQIGLSVGLIVVVEGLFGLAIVAIDLPTGHLADRMGPRQALILTGLLQSVACLLLFFVPSPLVYFGVQPIFALAIALSQGSDAALAYSLLEHAGRRDDFERTEGAFESALLAWNTIVFLIAAGTAAIGIRWVFLPTAVTELVGAAMLLRVPDDRGKIERLHVTLGDRLRMVRTAVASVGLGPDLLAMILAGTALTTLLFLTPVFVVQAGAPDYQVGVIVAIGSLLAAVVAVRLRADRDLRVSVALAVGGAVVLVVDHRLAVLASVVLVSIAEAHLLPRFRARSMGAMAGVGRATAMSVVTTAAGLGFALLAPGIGGIANHLGLTAIALACAGMFLLAGVVMSHELQTSEGSRT